MSDSEIQISISKSLLVEIDSLCQSMIDNTESLLAETEESLGRKTKKGRVICDVFEHEISQAKGVRRAVDIALGWIDASHD